MLESFPTLGAGEGPAVRVDVLMTEEERRVGCSQGSCRASRRVFVLVHGQQVGISEAILVIWAQIGLLPCVSLSADTQETSLAEAVPTAGPGVGLLTCVDELIWSRYLC